MILNDMKIGDIVINKETQEGGVALIFDTLFQHGS